MSRRSWSCSTAPYMKSIYSLRKITVEGPTAKPRQQKKVTDVSTSEPRLPDRKTTKSNMTNSKQSKAPSEKNLNKKNSRGLESSEKTTKISKVSLKNIPSGRRQNARLNKLDNDKNKDDTENYVPNVLKPSTKNTTEASKSPMKNKTETSKASDKNKITNYKGKPTIAEKPESSKKNLNEKIARVSKTSVKTSTKISKAPLKNIPSSRRQNSRLNKIQNDKNKDNTENSVPNVLKSSKKNITETSKSSKKNNTDTSKSPKKNNTETSKSPMKDITGTSKSPMKNTTEISNSSLGKTSTVRDVSPRTQERIQELIQNKKRVSEIREKMARKSEETVKSSQPTRVLRERNKVPNKYKDYSLDSTYFQQTRKARTPDPLDVYEFQYDPKEDPPKKKGKGNRKYESDSSDDDNSMKYVVKELRKQTKIVKFKPNKRNKKNNKPKVEQQTAEKPKVEQQKAEQPKVKQQKVETKERNEKSEKTDKIAEKYTMKIPQILIVPIELVSLSDTSALNDLPLTDQIDHPPEPIDHSAESIDLSPDPNISDSINLPDRSLQARNIVEEVTKSFFEDLSDDESHTNNNNKNPKGVKILSNVLINKPTPEKAPATPGEIFNSTSNYLKPAKPWRIDVSVIRKKTHFTYKDKSFTPRYDPEFILNDPKSNLKDKIIADKSKKVKLTYQASIVEYMNGLKPKIINHADDLFKDAPKKVQSPRKILGEINFVQSTPLKPHHAYIFKSPNVSGISSPKKKSDNMFGFSYFSDDENKENMRRSPGKSPKKAVVAQEALKPPQPKDIIQEKNQEKENVTINETENNSAINNDLSIALFQDVEKDLEVSKKCSRKYVRKNQKRRRLSSVDTLPNDSDSEPEKPVKKKQKNVQTKEEEREVDRLASHYNSMFEEIEKHELVIE